MRKNIIKNISIAMLVTLLVSLFSFIQIPQIELQKVNAALTCTPVDPAWFPDAEFTQCVSRSMGEGDDTSVCSERLSTLTNLDSSYCKNNGEADVIQDITGFERLTVLQTVDLEGNNITDLTPMAGKTTIEYLYLNNNTITDITPLGTLINLERLKIHNESVFPDGYTYRNEITDLSPLNDSGMNLSSLEADGNNISDISGLDGMSNLTNIDLSNNNISDLSTVDWSQLTNLITLSLGNPNFYFDPVNENSISDISPLTSLSATITTLNLHSNNISDLSTVDWSNLINLRNLNLNNNPFTSIDVLASAGSGFASSNAITIKYCAGLSTETTYQAAQTAVTTITTNGGAVQENISWENCSDRLDNDGDGKIDYDQDDLAGSDSYCFPRTFYINYASRSAGLFPSAYAVANCGHRSDAPCKDIFTMIIQAWFQTALADAPYDDITIYAKGASPNNDPEIVASMLRNTSIEPWPGETRPTLNGTIILAGENITFKGYEIKNFSSQAGIITIGLKNSTIEKNYIHDMGLGIAMLAGDNITIANNVLSQNTGAIRTDELNTLFSVLFPSMSFPAISIDACGGTIVAASRGTKIVNNTFYNNCDQFSFVENIVSPRNSIIQLGDIAVVSLSFLPLSHPKNTIIKQNLVFNDLTHANPPRTYYYNASGENINGQAVVGVIYDANAASHGDGNNFAETLTDPYVHAPAADYSAVATAFALNTHSAYQICTIAEETPSEDFSGNTKPNGPVEVGALELAGGFCGGSGIAPPTVACATPSPIDLPEELSITQDEEGDPTVELNWSKAKVSVEDFDTDTKIEILLKYLEKNPTIIINGNAKDLKNGFASYIFSSISKSISPTLKESFEKNLHYYADREIGVIKDMLKGIGIQEIFSDWWPYFAIHTLKNNENAKKIFIETLKESLYIITRNLAILREQSKEPIPILRIWSDFMTAFTKTLISRLEKEAVISNSPKFTSAVKCILNATRTALSSAENKFYNPFLAHAIQYYSPFEKELTNFFEKISKERKKQIKNALDDVIKEDVLKPIIESILYDSRLIKDTQKALDIGLTELLNTWKKHAKIMNLVNFYQTNEKFLIYKNLLFGTSYFTKIENCIESNYKNELLSMLKEVRYNVIYNMLSKNNDYGNNETGLMMDILTKIRNDSAAKKAIDPLIIKFISYLSSVSEKDDNNRENADIKRILEKEITIEVSPDFNEYYKTEAGVTKVEIIEGITTAIYRGTLYKDTSRNYKVKNAQLITTIKNPNVTRYLDENIPRNTSNSVIDYGYYIVASTNCDSSIGSIAKASINPIISDGTPIPNVFLNLKIQNKKGMSQRLMELLQELLESTPMQEATDQITTQVTNPLQIQQKIAQQLEPQLINQNTCFQSKARLLGEELTGDIIFSYLVDCVAFNQTIRYKIIQQREDIVPPLFLILKKTDQSQFEAKISTFMTNTLDNIIDQVEAGIYAKEGISALIPLKTTLLAKNSLDDFSKDEKMLIKCLGAPECDEETMQIVENLFKGASHATDVIIEKYDINNNLLDTFKAHVDLFGEANNIPIGEFISGDEYTLKIKLAYFNPITGETEYIKYVLPKISKVILRSAQLTSEGLTTTLTLNLKRPFQYGNFFYFDDVIDIKDIIAWGNLLKNNPEEWDHGNLDGLYGINLLDVVTLQENWGEIQEAEIQEEESISLADLADVLGFSFP